MRSKADTKQKIASLLACGYNCAQIAEKLGLHPSTVRNYRVEMRREHEGDNNKKLEAGELYGNNAP